MQKLKNYDPNVIEILHNRLYWSSTQTLVQDPSFFYFSVDDRLVYYPLHFDFGPIDIAKVYRFTKELLQVLSDPKLKSTPLVFYTSLDHAKRANSAFMICAFQIIVYQATANKVWEPFSKLAPALPAFRDASNTKKCSYPCTILDCLRGLEYAIKLKWFNFQTFDVAKYEHDSKFDNGDLNWIIPGKIVAFSGPYDKRIDPKGHKRMTPEDYVPIFRRVNVGTVIRLNEEVYNAEKFKEGGVSHSDIIFKDGSCPSPEIIRKFLSVCETETKSIAVHCKAGLGRTGTLIACYAMKHYKFHAADFIGWIRLCRPGSVLGPQQQFLVDIEPFIHGLCETSDIYKMIPPLAMEFLHKRKKEITYRSSLSDSEKKMAVYGDMTQGNDLLEAKEKQGLFMARVGYSLNLPKKNVFALMLDDEVPEEIAETVNRILLSKHECASRGTLSRTRV